MSGILYIPTSFAKKYSIEEKTEWITVSHSAMCSVWPSMSTVTNELIITAAIFNTLYFTPKFMPKVNTFSNGISFS